MQLSPRRNAWLVQALVSLACVVLALAPQGQDANWDLRNYHLYSPLAWLEGRFALDVAAAQLQTWHNPLLDVPMAWLVRAGAPGWLVAAWLAVPAIVALLFALRILDLLWPVGTSIARTIIAALVATAGAAVLPAIGTTLNDAFVAAGIVAALWWALESQGRRSAWATWIPAGLLAGAVAGLKLTAAIYCIGLIAAALVAGPARAAPARLLALAIGGVTGTAITGGAWAWYLWQAHGNPLFPYFNQWFLSPDALPIAHNDKRFLPVGWYDTLMVPVHLLVESLRFSESRLADPRLLLGLAALAVSLFAGRARAAAAPMPPATVAPSRWALPAFVFASYVAWLLLYGIYRYLYALELLLSIAIVGVLSTLVAPRWRNVSLAACLLAMIAATNHPNWERQPWRTPMIDVDVPPLPEGSMVLLADDDPLGHAVAFLPRSVPALSLSNNFMKPRRCTRMQAGIERRIQEHRGALYLLRVRQDPPATGGHFEAYGLSLHGSCLPIEGNLASLELCPLSRPAVSPTQCPWPAPDR